MTENGEIPMSKSAVVQTSQSVLQDNDPVLWSVERCPRNRQSEFGVVVLLHAIHVDADKYAVKEMKRLSSR